MTPTRHPAPTLFRAPRRRPSRFRRAGLALAAALLATGAAGPLAPGAAAQGMPIIYPAGGQTAQRQAQDEAECRAWAQQQTGFDPWDWGPSAPGAVATGDVVRGAAAGAAVGSVGGAIGGRAGRGAAVGAGVGAAAGLIRRGTTAEQGRDARRQDAAEFERQRGDFNRAFATCMRGRGYSVS